MSKKISLIFFFVFLFFPVFISAEEPAAEETPPEEPEIVCPSPPSPPSCSGSWSETEYRCIGFCKGLNQIRERNCSWSCAGPDAISDANGCLVGYGGCYEPCSSGCGEWGPWRDNQQCGEFEKCQPTASACSCSGSCYPKPTINPITEVLENVFEKTGRVKLPLKITWKELKVSPCSVESYQYQFTKEGEVVDNGCSTSLEAEIKDCAIKSNTAYDWQVQACSDYDCGDCGAFSDPQKITTSLAPELLSPYDPDWEKKEKAENVPIPTTFDWCDAENAQSYAVQVYNEGEIESFFPPYFPWVIKKEGGVLPSELTEDLGLIARDKNYEWQVSTCLNENGIRCGNSCSANQNIFDCNEYSQKWKFTTSETTLSNPEPLSPSYNPTNPQTVPVVNLESQLSWKASPRVFIYRYEIIKKASGNKILSAITENLNINVPFANFWNKLELNTVYNWYIKSCWGTEENQCNPAPTSFWEFKTTGTPPINLKSEPTAPEGNISIPATLKWDEIEGALSYYYELYLNQGFNAILTSGLVLAPKSEVSIEYPLLKQRTNYYWKVKTCADKNGKVCSNWSQGNFTTLTLSLPTNPNPKNNGELLTSENYLRWDGTSRFYQYRVYYGNVEKIPPTIVSTNSAFIPIEKLDLGNYTWYVQSCVDKDCKETSNYAGPWQFTLVQGKCEKGLLPCGRDCDIIGTSYNEREPCQLKHLFLLLKNVFDFVLWRLGLIALVLLILATGGIYYFSMGNPQTMEKVKSLLKSAGIGYGIVLSAWLIINWILIILGYQIGSWWKIIF